MYQLGSVSAEEGIHFYYVIDSVTPIHVIDGLTDEFVYKGSKVCTLKDAISKNVDCRFSESIKELEPAETYLLYVKLVAPDLEITDASGNKKKEPMKSKEASIKCKTIPNTVTGKY